MMITAQIAALAAARAGEARLANVFLGLGYTGVLLDDGQAGTCFTFRHDLGPACGVMPEAGALIGMPAARAIDMAMSTNLAQASLGVATINAVLNRDYQPGPNAMEVAEVRETDAVGVIGYFLPLIKQLQKRSGPLYVFEKNLTEDFLLPDWAEDIYLPACDVVFITGVTFINKTIDHILELAHAAKEIVVMGASSCMAPDILRQRGVTVLAGSRVSDPQRLLRVIAQGGGGRDVMACTEPLCLRLSPRRP